LDGLTVEFYRAFWGKVNFFLIDVLNKSYDEKLLSFSQRTSVLSLLFKKGDPLDPDPEACFLILYQKYNYWLDFHHDIL
jgi:hypothetical protein